MKLEGSGKTGIWQKAFLDRDEDAISDFWRDHEKRMKLIISKYISPSVQKRFSEDDVAQTAFRTFARRMAADEFEFSRHEDISNLLFAIAVNKTREKIRFHMRKKRGADREVYLSRLVDLKETSPLPEERDGLEEVQRVLGNLPVEVQRIVELRLSGKSQQEIAVDLECSERTVRRKLAELKETLQS